MEILLNGAKTVVQENNIFDLMQRINQNADGIAVAVNEEVIPKTEWKSFTINENDSILMITATQGG